MFCQCVCGYWNDGLLRLFILHCLFDLFNAELSGEECWWGLMLGGGGRQELSLIYTLTTRVTPACLRMGSGAILTFHSLWRKKSQSDCVKLNPCLSANQLNDFPIIIRKFIFCMETNAVQEIAMFTVPGPHRCSCKLILQFYKHACFISPRQSLHKISSWKIWRIENLFSKRGIYEYRYITMQVN